MNKPYQKMGILFILCPIVIFLLVAWVVELLWNGILTDVLEVKPIIYWQAMGILLLCKILFGGFGGKWGFGKCVDERRSGMTSEEKEKFKEMWKQRCAARFCNKSKE